MEISQNDKNLGMIAHGLVALTGLAMLLETGGFLNLIAPVASVILYFVWKSQSPFVVRHAKQAAGMQVALFILGLLVGLASKILMVTSVAAGSIGGLFATGGFFLLIALVITVATLVLGVMGLLSAQKGNAFTYPIVGRWVDGAGI